MKRLDEITIADLMPDSISRDAQVSATSRAIDLQLRLISEAVDKPLILPAIDDLSAGVLEHLAVQYDVTSWDSAWPIETKRAVLKAAIADKRKMGTRGAVQRAIEAVAPIATITEWWQDTSGDMPPHTFKIDLLQEESAVDPETQASVIAQVEEAKPVRSHYTFRVGQLLGGGLYFAGVLRAISYARVRSTGTTVEQTNIRAGTCAALRCMSIRRLLASSHMGDMPEPVVDVALFGGDFSGNNIRMESVDGGGGLIDKYASYKTLFELRGWEPGGLFIDKPRMMGICGVLTETSDSVVLVEVAKQLSVGRIEFTGSLTEGGIPESGVVEEYDSRPSVEIDLGIRFDPSNAEWLAKTFNTDEWWWSGILSSSDVSALLNFGCGYLPTNNVSYAFAGNIGALKYEGEKYEYKLLSMFGDVGSSPVAFDRSNFFFKRHYTDGNSSQYNGALLINSINAFATAVKSYRLKIIDKDPGAIYVLVGFKYSSGSWIQVTFSGVDDYFWAGIIYANDQTKLQELGLISDTSYPHDEILYSNAYNYEVVAMYSDMGVTSVQFDPSNFYIDKATSYPCISIFSRAAFSTPVMTWVCRIAPNPEYIDVILAFRWDTGNNEWMSVNFNYNPPDDNYWWGCLISSEDSEVVRKYGLKTASADWFGQYGGFLWSDDYTFQAIEVYSEIGQPVSGYDLTTLDCYSLLVSSLNKNVMAIRNLVKDTTNLKFWKCRITRKVAPALPTVSTINVSLSALGQSKSLENDGTSALYNSSTGYSQVLYDTSKMYATVCMNASAIWHSGFPLENGYGVVTVRNKTGSTMTISGGIIAQCDDLSATVITVYNSSDEAFNAFKYTANGTDYYYVLDDVQTDWTDDLGSIGYHLPPAATTCFFNQYGTPVSLDYLSQYYLYLNNGDMIPYSSSASLLGVYASDGTQVSGTFELINGFNPSGYFAIRCTSGSVRAAYCEISMGS